MMLIMLIQDAKWTIDFDVVSCSFFSLCQRANAQTRPSVLSHSSSPLSRGRIALTRATLARFTQQFK